MEKDSVKLPIYAKFALIFFSICLIFVLLNIGRHILIPVFLSLLGAILLRPIEVFLNQKLKIPHVLSVLLTVMLFVIFILGIIFFISWQISDLTDDWIQIKSNLNSHYFKIQDWIKTKFNISFKNQQSYVDKATSDVMDGNSQLMGNTIISFSSVLMNTLLIPIYTFLILLYKTLYLKFLFKIVKTENQKTLQEILSEIKAVVQRYITGLLIQMAIVATLTTGGLLILGVEYAVLLGVITAILNLIPYIGILIATLATLLATLVSSDSLSLVLGVVILSVVVQFIDNNILAPRIVGNKVRINAMVSVLGVIIGASIAGIAGMFLAIPFIAMIKVTFDRIEPLAPYGYLMGAEINKTYDWNKLKLFSSFLKKD